MEDKSKQVHLGAHWQLSDPFSLPLYSIMILVWLQKSEILYFHAHAPSDKTHYEILTAVVIIDVSLTLPILSDSSWSCIVLSIYLYRVMCHSLVMSLHFHENLEIMTQRYSLLPKM